MQRLGWGGNEVIELEEKHGLKTLYGVVVARFGDGKPVGHAVVELFDHPEMNSNPNAMTYPEEFGRHRLDACETDSSGSFEFNPPPGNYELRVSIGEGWNVTHYIVHVRKHGRKKALEVPMSVGT
jgi:putative component of toxin-antitoxin plasmid stabilization module